MRQLLQLVFCAFSLFISCASSDKNGATPAAANRHVGSTDNKMIIKIGNSRFTATLYDNTTTAAFKAMLPMTINMADLNGNEKYGDISKDLPTNASSPGTIKTGDLMLYGSGTLVLFYKTFSTSYSYTKLGHIDDIKGLADAVGSEHIAVRFEAE